MEKYNYILNIIDEITELLQKNNYTCKRYYNDVAWFQEKARIIKKNIIRIAIIGITSSGKSTLVNTFLQEKLLPVAIKPSSSIIITCSKGSVRQATIYFYNKDPIVLDGDELSEENIGIYCDENKNRNNKLQVAQIDIKTPLFMFDENIHIIDSPGLDACDLEIHEKVTMEILLPTIDVCLFLTTVKANSDEINLDKMRIVNRRGKQIILVQNMIDSVEEKIGRSGIVEESKLDILRKHKKRGENLLKSAIYQSHFQDRESVNNKNYISVKDLKVVQISALNAIKGIVNKDNELYEKSNFNELINEIKNCESKVAPKINMERSISLISKIESIIKTDREIIDEENGKIYNNFNIITRRNIDDTLKNFKKLKEKVTLKIRNIDKVLCECINDIKNLEDSYDLKAYEIIIGRINRERGQIEEEIFLTVKECEHKKNLLYKNLNMHVIYSYIIPSMDYENVKVIHKHEEKTKMIKKKGVFNKGKRIFSNVFDKSWGYEEKILDEKIIDKSATIRKLKNVCDVNRVKYVSILQEWAKQYTRSINAFYNEVSKLEKELADKKNQDIELHEIKEISNELEKIMDKLILRKKYIDELSVTLNEKKYLSSLNNNNDFKLVKSTIDKRSYTIYKIINSIYKQNYRFLGKYLNNLSNNILENKSIDLFWIWDKNTAIKFIERISGVYVSGEQISELNKLGMFRYKDIVVIYEDNMNKIKLHENLKTIYGGNYNVYIIFNGIQIANSEKYIINNIKLTELLKCSSFVINLVIDSYKEFFNGKNIKELLVEVEILKKKIIKKFSENKVGKILINAKNPIYNMALIECQSRKKFILSTYKNIKENLMENMLSHGTEEKETIEEILSFFLENGQNLEEYDGR